MISLPKNSKKITIKDRLKQIEHFIFLSYGNFINNFHMRIARDIHPQDLAKSCIIFSPHFDDETLGCGGTIIRKIERGADVRVVFMTDGRRSHDGFMQAEKLIALRTSEGISALKKLGVEREKVYTLGFPDTDLSNHSQQAFEKVKDLLFLYKPDQVYLPYLREPFMWSADHITTAKIVLNAIWSCPWSITTYEYPIWAWFHFPWIHISRMRLRSIIKNTVFYLLGISLILDLNTKLDIEGVSDLKRSALDQHQSQMVELIPGVNWPTLKSVDGGEWLKLFFRKYEYFRVIHHKNLRVTKYG